MGHDDKKCEIVAQGDKGIEDAAAELQAGLSSHEVMKASRCWLPHSEGILVGPPLPLSLSRHFSSFPHGFATGHVFCAVWVKGILRKT